MILARTVRRLPIWVLAGIMVLLLAPGNNPVLAQPQAAPLIPEDELIRLRAAPIPDSSDGARLFVGNCATCHDNRKVGEGNPDAYTWVILNGIWRGSNGSMVVMPSFAHQLSNEEIATLVNYLVERVGDKAGSLTPEHVARQRAEISVPAAP